MTTPSAEQERNAVERLLSSDGRAEAANEQQEHISTVRNALRTFIGLLPVVPAYGDTNEALEAAMASLDEIAGLFCEQADALRALTADAKEQSAEPTEAKESFGKWFAFHYPADSIISVPSWRPHRDSGMREERQQTANGSISLTLPVPPSANRWWRNVQGRMVTSREAREYKADVATRCLLARLQPIPAPTPVILTVIWFRERKSGDLDKRLGVLLDALQGTVYDSDAQIVKLTAERHDTDHQNPRVEVEACRALIL